MGCGGHHATVFDGVAIGSDEPSPGALAHALSTALPHQLGHAFLLGLLPVIGNLMSNTLITIVGLSLSIWVAVAALGYLIFIHKLEYFLNARIVGGQISAKSWELLLAMLVFEAAFGLPGVVAGPIYYAYLKSELRRAELV